jgi:hypothetical protein
MTMTAATHEARANAVSQEVARRFCKFAIDIARSRVKDAGGKWTRELRDVAHKAAKGFLFSSEAKPIIGYHGYESSLAAWRGDTTGDRLQRAANHAAKSIGRLVPQRAMTFAIESVCRHLGEDSGVTLNIRQRDRDNGGKGEYQIGDSS